MGEALGEAWAAGIEVEELSPEAPGPLFVLGRMVFYRPSGCPKTDAATIRQGVALVKATQGCVTPQSGVRLSSSVTVG